MKLVKMRITPASLEPSLLDALALTTEERELKTIEVYCSLEQFGLFSARAMMKDMANGYTPVLGGRFASMLLLDTSQMPTNEVHVYNRAVPS